MRRLSVLTCSFRSVMSAMLTKVCKYSRVKIGTGRLLIKKGGRRVWINNRSCQLTVIPEHL